MNTAQMNRNDWRADLQASRDLSHRDKAGFKFLLDWMENWRSRKGLEPGRESAKMFWRAQVKPEARESWQLERRAEAVRWYP